MDAEVKVLTAFHSLRGNKIVNLLVKELGGGGWLMPNPRTEVSLEIETITIGMKNGVATQLEYNPMFVDRTSDKQLRTIIMHEALHLYLNHHERFRIMKRYILRSIPMIMRVLRLAPHSKQMLFMMWNLAADLEVNGILARENKEGMDWQLDEGYAPGQGKFYWLTPTVLSAESYMMILMHPDDLQRTLDILEKGKLICQSPSIEQD